MEKTLTIKNGALRLPRQVLKKFRWSNNTRLRLEEKADGIVLSTGGAAMTDAIGSMRGFLKGSGVSVARHLHAKKLEKSLEP